MKVIPASGPVHDLRVQPTNGGSRTMNTTTKAQIAKYIGDLHHEHMMWLNTP